MKQPSYSFSPSLLDAHQRMIDTKAEDYFYQDESGAWHLNWNETDEKLHFSEEEVDALLRQEFIDRVNKIPTPPSEAASKGTAFNEIVDCLVKNRKPFNTDIVIKTVRSGTDLYNARRIKRDCQIPDCEEQFMKIGKPFIYADVDGFEFFFDKNFCLDAANYFKDSICQYYTKADLETSKGVVELHGYIDYLRYDKVYDAKTTKKYTFGDFSKRWQRYVYPFCLIESNMMDRIDLFEFTVFLLKGGTSNSPLIDGVQYKEVYTYDHEQARQVLVQKCERIIEFLEENKELITNKKVFGYAV